MKHPPLTPYADPVLRLIEYDFVRITVFDGRSTDLEGKHGIESVYPNAKPAKETRDQVRFLDPTDWREPLLRIAGDPKMTLEMLRSQIAAHFDGNVPLDPTFDGNSTDPSAKTPSSPERKLSRQETKVASKRKVAKDRAIELHREDFVPSPIYNPIIKQLRELHGSGQTREAVLDALESLITPVRADLTNGQIDLLYTKANELLDGLYRPEKVMRTLLNPPTNGDRSKYKSALYLLLQIQTRYKVGEEFAMPDKDMAGLAGVSKAKGSLDEVKGTLCKLKAIEQIHRGKRSATVRIATTYRRLI